MNDIIPTGLKDLDRLLKPCNLIVIAGRFGHGADILATNIARNAAVNDAVPTLFTSCWSGIQEMAERLIAAQAGVPLTRLANNKLTADDETRIARIADRMEAAPLFLNADKLTVTQIAEHVAKTGARLAVIEGAHLLTDEETPEDPEHRADIQACALKRLAMTAGIPVVVSVALPGRAGRPADAEPVLRDFDYRDPYTMPSDAVILVHRPDQVSNTPRVCEIDIVVAKHRNGVAFSTTACIQPEYDRIIGFHRDGAS